MSPWTTRWAGGLTIVCLLVSGCATPPPRDDTAFRQSRPRSILVLPPVNDSPDVRATYGMLTTVTRPIAEAGYYVFPVALVDQTFKENGLVNPVDMHQAPLSKLREIFGADAALYITIEQYGASYKVIESAVVVTARAKLIDIRDGQLLWTGRATASDSEGRTNNNSGLAGLLVTAVVRQVLSASLSDGGHSIAAVTSQRLLAPGPGRGLPYGPRSPNYLQDKTGR